jgi:hypothetical protein
MSEGLFWVDTRTVIFFPAARSKACFCAKESTRHSTQAFQQNGKLLGPHRNLENQKSWFSTETIGQIGVGSDGSADSETDSAMIAEEISHQHGDAIWDVCQIIDDIKLLLSSHRKFVNSKLRNY